MISFIWSFIRLEYTNKYGVEHEDENYYMERVAAGQRKDTFNAGKRKKYIVFVDIMHFMAK